MPRTITNRAGLPLPMYNALAHDDYVGGGDITSTKLIGPPRITTLRKYHEDEIKEEAADRIWSLMGKSVHYMLGVSGGVNPEDFVRETRLVMPVQGVATDDGFLTWKLSAQPDVYHKSAKELYDYKVTSVWSLIFGEKPEWERQLNIQALLHRHHGDEVEKINIVVILRDWQVRKARMEKNYPPQATQLVGLPLWDKEEQLEYVRKRVRLHQQAQLDYIKSNQDPNVLPMCSDNERWYRGHKYKVKKMATKDNKINKKSDRVFDSKTDALQWMTDNAANLPKGKVWAPIEEQKGENIRCLYYCDVWFKCPFGRAQREAAMAAPLVNENDEED